MIDIETLGKQPGCCVLSIGACVFSTNGVQVANQFHQFLDYEEQQYTYRCHVDTQTLKWWFKQKNQVALNPENSLPLKEALTHLANYIRVQGKDVKIWANSPQFDIAILEELYRRAGMQTPWKYWQIMDFRTMSAMKPELHKEKRERGDYHDALGDAIAQAEVLAILFGEYGLPF